MHRLFIWLVGIAVCAGAVYGLVWLDGQMDVRYQALGVVTDRDGQPLEGVEVALLLEPPPQDGVRRDEFFMREGMKHRRRGQEGTLKRTLGPVIGLSDSQGAYVVRVVGRTGTAKAIRLGLDTGGRPPFETAWLLFRKAGYPDVVKTMSILGWRSASEEWGPFANRLPQVSMGE